MTAQASPSKVSRSLHLVFGALLIGVFFLSWVSWDGHKINGADFPGGRFFEKCLPQDSVSATHSRSLHG